MSPAQGHGAEVLRNSRAVSVWGQEMCQCPLPRHPASSPTEPMGHVLAAPRSAAGGSTHRAGKGSRRGRLRRGFCSTTSACGDREQGTDNQPLPTAGAWAGVGVAGDSDGHSPWGMLGGELTRRRQGRCGAGAVGWGPRDSRWQPGWRSPWAGSHEVGRCPRTSLPVTAA